jgi:hypothetical protein
VLVSSGFAIGGLLVPLQLHGKRYPVRETYAGMANAIAMNLTRVHAFSLVSAEKHSKISGRTVESIGNTYLSLGGFCDLLLASREEAERATTSVYLRVLVAQKIWAKAFENSSTYSPSQAANEFCAVIAKLNCKNPLESGLEPDDITTLKAVRSVLSAYAQGVSRGEIGVPYNRTCGF